MHSFHFEKHFDNNTLFDQCFNFGWILLSLICVIVYVARWPLHMSHFVDPYGMTLYDHFLLTTQTFLLAYVQYIKFFYYSDYSWSNSCFSRELEGHLSFLPWLHNSKSVLKKLIWMNKLMVLSMALSGVCLSLRTPPHCIVWFLRMSEKKNQELLFDI